MKHLDRLKNRMDKEDLDTKDSGIDAKIIAMFAAGLTSEQIIAKEKKEKKDKEKKEKP